MVTNLGPPATRETVEHLDDRVRRGVDDVEHPPSKYWRRAWGAKEPRITGGNTHLREVCSRIGGFRVPP